MTLSAAIFACSLWAIIVILGGFAIVNAMRKTYNHEPEQEHFYTALDKRLKELEKC